MTFRKIILGAALLCAATLSLAQPATGHAGMNHGPAGAMDMKAMMKDSNDQMASMKMTGDPDIDFAAMMRIHHQGGVEMAKAQLRDGRNPQMRKLAQDIISSQNAEIATFEKFLKRKGHPVEKK
jgi:uncharacterized protein (DUF305 family)